MNILYKGLKVIAILLILISATNIFKNFENHYNLKPYNGGVIVEQDFVVDDCTYMRQYIAENNIKIYRTPNNSLEPYYYSNTNDTSVPINNNVNYNSVDYLCGSNNSGNYRIDTSESSVTSEEFSNYLNDSYGANTVSYTNETPLEYFFYPSIKYVIFLVTSIIFLLVLMLLDKRDKKIKATALYHKELKYIVTALVTYGLLFFITDSYLSNYLSIFIVILIIATNLLVLALSHISTKIRDNKIIAWLLLGVSIISLAFLTIKFLPHVDDVLYQYQSYNYYKENADFYDDFYLINGGINIEGVPNYNEKSMQNIEQYLISFYIGEDGTVYVNENYIKMVYGEEYLGYHMYIHESDREQYCGSDLKCTDDVYVYTDDIKIKPLSNSYGMSGDLVNPTIIVSKSNAEGNILPLTDVQTIEYYQDLITKNSIEPDSTIGLQLYSYDQILTIKYQSFLYDLLDYINYVFLGLVLLALSIVYFVKVNKKE